MVVVLVFGVVGMPKGRCCAHSAMGRLGLSAETVSGTSAASSMSRHFIVGLKTLEYLLRLGGDKVLRVLRLLLSRRGGRLVELRVLDCLVSLCLVC